MSKHKLVGCLFAILAMSPLSAFAEEPAQSQAGSVAPGTYAYTFDDDPLAAGAWEGTGSLIRVRAGAARVMLMRPRLQFVNELVKSAEGL
jgi:hypothetical protein